MKKELKEEVVRFKGTATADKSLREFEVDGWTAYREDINNNNRIIRMLDDSLLVRVRFERSVSESKV